MKDQTEFSQNVFRFYLQSVYSIVVTTIILFLSAGHVSWLWAWIYISLLLLHSVINALLLSKELKAERGKPKEKVEKWDQLLLRGGAIPALATLLIAGLDNRFDWSPEFRTSIHISALALHTFGNTLLSWAMISNPFFSTIVRLQEDRGHWVVQEGPYRVLRHPGYAGILVTVLITPILLGSMWALVPAAMMMLIYLIRTSLEDRMLMQDLVGYQAYAKIVKHRLFPGVW